MLEFRNFRVDLIPWLRVRNENVHLWTKPARIVQTRGVDSNRPSCALGILASRHSRAALGAKASLVSPEFPALSEMIAQRPTRQRE